MTASAALDSGKYTPTSTFVDPGYCTVYGKRVNNFDTSRPFGTVSLATALQFSVNSVFCNIGLKLGAKRIVKQAKKFGFYERPPLETPESERLPSGLYRNGKLYDPKRDRDVDAGRMAFGQERLLVTPRADGDGGGHDRQRRHPDAPVRGREDRDAERQDAQPDEADEDPARGLARSGARHRRDDGARRAGRHGHGGADLGSARSAARPARPRRASTATTRRGSSRSRATDGKKPKLAIAVVLQNQSLTGGATAAPIARQVMQALLTPTANP